MRHTQGKCKESSLHKNISMLFSNIRVDNNINNKGSEEWLLSFNCPSSPANMNKNAKRQTQYLFPKSLKNVCVYACIFMSELYEGHPIIVTQYLHLLSQY